MADEKKGSARFPAAHLTAYCAVVMWRGFSLGLCELDRPGYVPVPDAPVFDNWDAAHAEATKRNADEFGLDALGTYTIVTSSFRSRR